MTLRRRLFWAGLLGVTLLATAATFDPMRSYLEFVLVRSRGGFSVSDRVDQYSVTVAERLRPQFVAAGVPYPPAELALIAFKDSKTLEVYARDPEKPWAFVKSYPVLAASGRHGPKLVEGDRQVPEGMYRVEALNPNSRFHLALRLDYPNAFDRRMADRDGRSQLGSDIMIHGSSVSVGCLAMGDDAAEDLFVLSALIDRENVRVIISPTDFRTSQANLAGGPVWLGELYESLRQELQLFSKRI